MSIVVDQALLERALTILRESDDYRQLKLSLDEYFHQDGWADSADSSGPFALAFTRNSETEGGWLSQSDLETFWNAVALVDPQRPSSGDSFHQFLQQAIAAWQSAPSGAADEAGPTEFQSVTEMGGANYAGWRQGYDPTAQVWKYRDPANGLWRESHEAFPAVAPGSRVFHIGERTFLSAGNGEQEVWPDPDLAGAYYDATDTYDQLGNVTAPATAAPATAAPATAAPATEATAGAEEPADPAELERELRELFEIPPDWPVWVSAP